MIKNIIFDFGDIFINLDKPATIREFTKKFGAFDVTPEMDHINKEYEKGLVTSKEFVDYYLRYFPTLSKEDIINAWNAILLDFPEYRLEFIEKLAAEKKYRLFLLSNTNDIHIKYVEKTMLPERYQRFKKCFEQFYLSHEINFRKPDSDIYEFVLNQNNLVPEESLFIDDTEENTISASKLGINTWNLIPNKDEITNLFKQKFNF